MTRAPRPHPLRGTSLQNPSHPQRLTLARVLSGAARVSARLHAFVAQLPRAFSAANAAPVRPWPVMRAGPEPETASSRQRKWAERGNTLPRFSAARSDHRERDAAWSQAASASRRGDGGGEGALASLQRRPISSCAAGLWIQPRPCRQSGSKRSSKATARQLANWPDRASSLARACTCANVLLKSRLARVMRGV